VRCANQITQKLSREKNCQSLREFCVRYVGPTGCYVTAAIAQITILLSPFRTPNHGGWVGWWIVVQNHILGSARSDAVGAAFPYRKKPTPRAGIWEDLGINTKMRYVYIEFRDLRGSRVGYSALNHSHALHSEVCSVTYNRL
jgi:hypothetical protein